MKTKFHEIFIGIFSCLFLGTIFYILFIVVPVSIYAQAECLRAGYPKSEVTIGLERYCITLDGSVIVKVDKQ